MATRKETQEQRRAVERSLRELLLDGSTSAGAHLPPVREIAQAHGVSLYIAYEALRSLKTEGLFHAVPSVGTFAGRSHGKPREPFVMVWPEGEASEMDRQVRLGFEDGIAACGGAVLTWSCEQARVVEASGVSGVAGVFEWAWWLDCELRETARARFGPTTEVGEKFVRDSVEFDDRAGGREVTEHLLSEGHRNIAFLGLHVGETGPNWSRERESGWRELLETRGLPTLAFYPDRAPRINDVGDEERCARQAARALLRDGGLRDISAVVAVNDAAALQLLEELQEQRVPRAYWPALVGFDNEALLSEHLLTSLRLPWEEVGRAAAQLLWGRRQQLLNGTNQIGEAQHRRVAMKLIPRLSCRKAWALEGPFNQPIPAQSQRATLVGK